MEEVARLRQSMEAAEVHGELTRAFWDTRIRSLKLAETLEHDDFVVQTAAYMSPPKWHLGHVSWLFEVVMSRVDESYRFHSEEFSAYLNSYYNQFGEPHQKARRGVVSRPTLQQILRYYDMVSGRMAEFIAGHAGDDAVHLTRMGMHHECQHQELMVYDLQHLLADRYRPAWRTVPPDAPNAGPQMVPVGGGLYRAGFGGGGFCYDIEMPEHRTYLEDYRIGRFPVTNGEYMQFMESGGYEDFGYWLDDGWRKVREEGWSSPMYWEKIGGEWHMRDLAGTRPVNPAEPVVHVSYYEADAYAKWAGGRLPTEYEWERAACWNEQTGTKAAFPWGDGEPTADRCNLLESGVWRPAAVGSYPQGASPCGCEQMIGDVWEWTASEYMPYPGFRSGFKEYNDKWFTCQKVLRGGSFATPSMSIRGSYRNFFRLDERWMTAGFRMAS